MSDQKPPRVIDNSVVYSCKWLELHQTKWQGTDQKIRVWESVRRVNDYGAVVIIAVTKISRQLILLRQYRPAVDAWVYEFPAGLIDSGESIATASQRELYEETGYHGEIMSISPLTYTSPGLSNESIYLVQILIDDSSTENSKVTPNNYAEEHLTVITVDLDKLSSFYQKIITTSEKIDSKLAAWIIAREFSNGEGK